LPPAFCIMSVDALNLFAGLAPARGSDPVNGGAGAGSLPYLLDIINLAGGNHYKRHLSVFE
jgi:hypothetical protein